MNTDHPKPAWPWLGGAGVGRTGLCPIVVLTRGGCCNPTGANGQSHDRKQSFKTIRRTVTFFGVAVALFWSLAPIYWIIVTSLKTSREIMPCRPPSFPRCSRWPTIARPWTRSFRNMC